MAAVMGPGAITALEPLADTVCRLVRQAVDAAAPELAGAADLVSLALPLPVALLDGAVIGGDTRWRAPHGELEWWAVGTVVSYVDEAHYRRDCAQWHCCGDAVPLTFFSVPPATEPARPTVWLPQVLLRRDGAGFVLTLTARRAGRTPAQMAAAWLDAVRTLFTAPASPGHSRLVAQQITPDAATWCERVAATCAAIRAGRFAKAVLARRLRVQLSHAVDVGGVLARLAQMYPGCHVLSLPHGKGQVVAATPEQLAIKRGGELVSHALAGTVRRRRGTQEEALAVAQFFASPKERREHALVVESIKERMLQLCSSVEHAAVPSLLSLRFVQHLWTRVHGRLHDGVGLLDAVRALHPTPAVLGTPTDAAQAWLAECGERRDGLYTGVVGWIDRHGDGDAVVVLRAAYLEDDSAVLWAGAGIMAESDPATELAETELKLQTMLEVLGSSA
jgi:menaquinone-specific isochorismate synthase